MCLNCTPATATLSEALAETATDAPEITAVSDGAVRETVGAVESLGEDILKLIVVSVVLALDDESIQRT